MIYIAELTAADGKTKRHSGRPSKKFLKAHPEFVKYYESGNNNEYNYRTHYKIENATLIEVSDSESHERNFGIANF